MTWTDVVGLVGVAMILGAYLLLQIGQIKSDAPLYSIANAVGASLVLFSLFFAFNLSAMIVEAFWVLISLIGLYRAVKQRRNAHTSSAPPDMP